MSDTRARIERLPLIGGALCLDFTNTTAWRPDPAEGEALRDYGDLLAWSVRTSALTESEARALARAAVASPGKAEAARRRTVALREALYRIFSAVAAGRGGDSADLELLNRHVGEANRHLEIAPGGDGYRWAWRDTESELDLPSWRVARSAAELLVSPDLARVRECSGDRCDWLFVDDSRNHSRRWCDMASCGNRAKARRNYARRRAGAKPGGRG